MEKIDNSETLPSNTNINSTGIIKMMNDLMLGREVDGHHQSEILDREALRSIKTDTLDPTRIQQHPRTRLGYACVENARRQHQRLNTAQALHRLRQLTQPDQKQEVLMR
jgi:hypothetical protein